MGTHCARVVPDPEAVVGEGAVCDEVPASSALEVGVVLAGLRQLVEEGLVADRTRPKALFVQQSQDAVVVLQNKLR